MDGEISKAASSWLGVSLTAAARGSSIAVRRLTISALILKCIYTFFFKLNFVCVCEINNFGEEREIVDDNYNYDDAYTMMMMMM